jgi:hypothetical protein
MIWDLCIPLNNVSVFTNTEGSHVTFMLQATGSGCQHLPIDLTYLQKLS